MLAHHGAYLGLPGRLHRDQCGSISIVSVFALMLLVVLLGLVMNAGRQVDQKVKMQNAADSATYAGGVVLARGMNTLAFTNHLLSDVFALTAFFREARDRNAESLTPEILDNWQRVAPAFQGSEFPKFDELGYAIEEKVPRERDMVYTFSEWAYAAQEIMLPVFEEILAERMIPDFQRALVDTAPYLAQYAADEVARRHGRAWPKQVDLRGVIWRTNANPVGGMSEAQRRTLPVVDPVMDMTLRQAEYVQDAQEQRERLAHRYLRDWNNESLHVFDVWGKMSQFSNLWRIFTCGQLNRLLQEEYPNTNLPFQIRDESPDFDGVTRDYLFVGVVYRDKMKDKIPGVFKNPVAVDTQAYAQLMMFVPRRRLVKVRPGSGDGGNGTIGGVPGQPIPLPGPREPGPQPPPAEPPASEEPG